MPFITDTAMQKVATKLQSFETREEKRKIEVRQKLNEAKTVAESSLGAALVGFMHGRFEDADANFFIPRMSEFRKIDPGAVAIRQRDLNKRRRFPLGFQPTTVLGGSTSNIPAAPQDMFRPERLVIPSDIAFDFGVQDVKVGNTSQLVSGGEVPAALFTEVAIDTHVHFKTAEIGNQMSVSVRNKTGAPIEFSAGVVGTVVQA
jgi:hypothetical protein